MSIGGLTAEQQARRGGTPGIDIVLLKSRYEVLEPAGSGGEGRVFGFQGKIMGKL